jgi:hypothetical protein
MEYKLSILLFLAFMTEVLRFVSRQGQNFFFSPQRADRLQGQPASSSGYREFFQRRVKQPGREADHTSPYNAEDNNSYFWRGV